ncbi:MAG: cytochrome c3 family protein [bacterium]|jgi:hypothetical protein|nr:cytochrome c3 family protein [bacterium]
MKTFLTTILTTLFLASAVSFALAADPVHPGKMQCSLCHLCDTPTPEDPCMRPCPRNIIPATMEVPDIVIMDDLEALYVPVRFNHKLHAEMAGMDQGCETCHHYEENAPVPSSCKTCHPIEIQHEDLSQPGLKGAYHRQCLSCHTQWDKETACEVCHEKKAGGLLHGTATTHAIHTKHKPIEMKELIVFETEYEENDKVPFHHRLHATKYERNCDVCHKQQSCASCHVDREESHPMGDLSEIDLHETCFLCHEESGCEHCHGRDSQSIFSHDSTGWPLKGYHANLYCRNCHAERGPIMKLNPDCTHCHTNGWKVEGFDHASTGITLDEVHQEADCESCHTKGISSPATCAECHDDKRKYNPEKDKGFVGEPTPEPEPQDETVSDATAESKTE